MSWTATDWTKTLSVGDEVAYNTSRDNSPWGYHFDHVERRITKTTVVLVGGRRFNRDGQELESAAKSFPNAMLADPGNAREAIARNEKRRDTRNAVHALTEALAGRRNGFGDYSLDDEMVALVTALTAKLKGEPAAVRIVCENTLDLAKE